MKYWDSSALVQLCTNQPSSELVEGLAREDSVIVTSWLTRVECWSAFARLQREARLTPQEADESRGELQAILERSPEIRLTNKMRILSGRLLRMHPLRAGDSLQLASAIVWARGNPDGHQFICLDSRLAEAARLEGFQVLPEDREK